MNTDNKISLIVPAFNEEGTIGAFLIELKKILAGLDNDHEIIVVDDGSTDETFVVVDGMEGVDLIRHPYNKGNGAAVKTGIRNSHGEKLIVIDADGQHDPEHIPEMIRLLDQYDLVVGARETFGLSKRGFGNVFVSKLATYLSGIAISDLTCGFRAFRKEKMMEFIALLPNGFSLPSTSTLAFATSGYNVKFIPIRAHLRQGGKSSIKVLRDGMKFLVLIVRMVSLFKPLKIFVPISLVMFLLGFLWSIRTISYSGGLSPTVVMLFLSGIFTLLIGLLVDHLSETRLLIGKIFKNQVKEDTDNNKQ